jgi:hypothetical protein
MIDSIGGFIRLAPSFPFEKKNVKLVDPSLYSVFHVEGYGSFQGF